MHSDWLNGIEILQGRWQHGEKVGYCYPSGLEKTFCKWDIYVPRVMKGLKSEEKYVYFSWRPVYVYNNISLTSCSEKCCRQKL
jgi:hypothetical protein